MSGKRAAAKGRKFPWRRGRGGTPVIDCHVHCGNDRRTKYYPAGRLVRDLEESAVNGAVLFAFPEDMYRRVDRKARRIAANDYVLEACRGARHLYPFYFVWNDYLIPPDLGRYRGIKWHRHPDEPRYDYADPRCAEFLAEVRRHRLPVLLEEEFEHTVRFVERNPELDVIIPHMGERNGGTFRMEAFRGHPRVYFDTSTASQFEIDWILDLVGPRRVLFGSDVSGTLLPFFNFARIELMKLEGLGLTAREREMVYGGNLLRLLRRAR
ncbi:MAG: amidohydrolase family protein [bacterium]|nr:amidohydrolase family protein [bacterium]